MVVVGTRPVQVARVLREGAAAIANYGCGSMGLGGGTKSLGH